MTIILKAINKFATLLLNVRLNQKNILLRMIKFNLIRRINQKDMNAISVVREIVNVRSVTVKDIWIKIINLSSLLIKYLKKSSQK